MEGADPATREEGLTAAGDPPPVLSRGGEPDLFLAFPPARTR